MSQQWALIRISEDNCGSKLKILKESGVTVILTTHYLDEAEQLSDRVCVMDGGLIKLIDTPDKLKADFNMNNLEDVFIALMSDDTLH